MFVFVISGEEVADVTQFACFSGCLIVSWIATKVVRGFLCNFVNRLDMTNVGTC